MYEEYSNHDVAVYGGYVIDDNEILKSASGGVATALADHFIKNGGYVAGVVYSKDFYSAEYLLTNNIEDIAKFRGSKYIDVDKKTIYNDVKNLLLQGEKVLFFGFPCVVAAIKRFCRDVSEKLILCELICSGPTRPEVQKQYVQYLEKRHKSKVTGFSVRYKKEEWLPKYIRAEFENGDIFVKEFAQTPYSEAFYKMGMDRCYSCPFKGNNRKGDIMIGDFWGATEIDPYWNKKGVSAIFAETEKGNKLINEVESIKLFDSTFERVASKNLRVNFPRKKDSISQKFCDIFDKRGLFVASKKARTLETKIKEFIKIFIPKFVITGLKRFINNFKKV